MLVELAELQDREVGDGTTSVVIVASELLKVIAASRPFHFFSVEIIPGCYNLKGWCCWSIWLDDILLQRANDLVRNGIHPTSIISGYRVSDCFPAWIAFLKCIYLCKHQELLYLISGCVCYWHCTCICLYLIWTACYEGSMQICWRKIGSEGNPFPSIFFFF